ncbi:hypothetical protein [Geoanaerobacter pelophilus]|uniref:DUF5640 domain-containing protein n=1 Tax=Geobacter sp. (strain M21) TaxID=443144 RepID=C6E4Y6_GEOSM|nr:hypothetical protein [Geoanaerobacter pelophilus]
MVRGIFLVLMLCVLTTLASCSNAEEDPLLIGTWKSEGEWILKFRPDHTGVFRDEEFTYVVTPDKQKRGSYVTASVNNSMGNYNLFNAVRNGNGQELNVYNIDRRNRKRIFYFTKISN